MQAMGQGCQTRPRLRKLVLIELTMGMSTTATDYAYTIYIWQSFSFGEEHIEPTYVMILHMHVHG
jgi:hypothetical protein